MEYTNILLLEAPKKKITGDPAIPKKIKPGAKHSIPDSFLDKLKVKLDKIIAANPAKAAEAKKLFDQIKAKHLEMVALKKAKAELKKKQKLLTKTQADLIAKHKKATSNPVSSADLDGLTKKYQALIERDCKEYLKSVKATKKLLYRGMSSTFPIFVGKPWNDREPKDTDLPAHEFFNKMLTLGGFKANRANSIFCSSSQSFADSYGDLYIIFPKDGFNFTWSDQWDDFYGGPLASANEIRSYFKVKDKNNSLSSWMKLVSNCGYAISKIMVDLYYLLQDAEETLENSEESTKNQFDKAKLIHKYLVPYYDFLSNYEESYEDDDPFTYIQDNYDDAEDDWDYNYDSEEEFEMEFWRNFNENAKTSLTTLIKLCAVIKKIPVSNKIKKLPILVAKLQKILVKKPKTEQLKITKTIALAGLKKLGFYQDDLIGALNSRHEIYITGEYYAFKVRDENNDDDDYDYDKKSPGFISGWDLRKHQDNAVKYAKEIGAIPNSSGAKKSKKSNVNKQENHLKYKVGKELIKIYTAKPKKATKIKKKK